MSSCLSNCCFLHSDHKTKWSQLCTLKAHEMMKLVLLRKQVSQLPHEPYYVYNTLFLLPVWKIIPVISSVLSKKAILASLSSCLEVNKTATVLCCHIGFNLAQFTLMKCYAPLAIHFWKNLADNIQYLKLQWCSTIQLTYGVFETLSWKHKDPLAVGCKSDVHLMQTCVCRHSFHTCSSELPWCHRMAKKPPWRRQPHPHQISALANQFYIRLQPLALSSSAPPLQLNLHISIYIWYGQVTLLLVHKCRRIKGG